MNLIELVRAQWDRTAAIVASVLGAGFLLLGWVGVSGTSFLGEQTPYIVSGGIGGLFFLGIGATLWISADLRDEWRKLDRIEQALADGSLRWTEGPDAGIPADPASPSPRHIDLGRDDVTNEVPAVSVVSYVERHSHENDAQWMPSSDPAASHVIGEQAVPVAASRARRQSKGRGSASSSATGEKPVRARDAGSASSRTARQRAASVKPVSQ